MTVYLDLVILLNFIVDLLLLVGTNRLSGYPLGLGRCVLAAALGGVYGGACLLPGFRFLSSTLWRLVSLGVMGLLAFGLVPGTLRRCVLFALLSMALGGIALGLGSGSFGSLVGAAGAVCGMCLVGFSGKAGSQQYIRLSLRHNGRVVELMALHDTGNTLRDPVTGERVIVAGPEAARKLLGLTPEQLRSPIETVASGVAEGLRLIPYRAVGQSHGMLPALRVREARVGDRKGSVLIAFTAEGLGEEHTGYEALVGGAI